MPTTSDRVQRIIGEVFPQAEVQDWDDAGGGRGVFSTVVRLTLRGQQVPPSVVVKLAVEGPNGDAARRSGAYERERLAYSRILADHTRSESGRHVATPRCWAVVDELQGPAFVLEDLTQLRRVDQTVGLTTTDATAVLATLAAVHGLDPPAGLRSNTASQLDPNALAVGFDTLSRRWSTIVDSHMVNAWSLLLHRRIELTEQLAVAGQPVLCHGDPRADNVVFDTTGRAVAFDWQQIAVQPGVCDVAWLAATSLEPELRKESDAGLRRDYAVFTGQELSEDNYRLGFVLPGLAVLFLAQREAPTAATHGVIAASLRRIGQALVDLDVASLMT